MITQTLNTKRCLVSSGLLACLLLAGFALPGFAQQPTAAERAAMLKATLEASKVVLRQYEWIETTVVSLKGDEKSRKQERCYYGADGKLQKVLLSQSAPESLPGGFLRRRIAEREREELNSYMKGVISLVKTYVPPSPAKVQAAKEAGKVSINLLEPGKRAQLTFADYEKDGDSLGVEVDLTNNHPLGVKVSTYLDDATETVTADVRMGKLNDGTTYPSEMTIDAKAKKLQVTVQNSGYRKATQ
jgi:hypothetical protein